MRKILTILLLVTASLFVCGLLFAHPIGTKWWGHRTTVTLKANAIQIDYIIEVPLTKLALMMNRFRSIRGIPRMGPKEEARFNQEFLDYLQQGIKLNIDEQPARLIWNPNYAKKLSAGDPGFFEYHLHLISPLEGKPAPHIIKIKNNNYPLERAVFHNEILSLPGVHAENPSVKKDMNWEEGKEHRAIFFQFTLGDATSATAKLREPIIPRKIAQSGDLLALLRQQEFSIRTIWIALGLALILGAIHALSPGHGKALVAAYLVGSRGTLKHAVILGIIVTITHISSVVIIGLIALIAARYFVPEYYYPFISLLSGILIVGIGIWLFIHRFFHKHHHELKGHMHPTAGQLFWLGISGGMVPCPSAMAVMLTAIAIGRIPLGLTLIISFSIGLSSVLIMIGILTVKASTYLDRVPRSEFIKYWLPVISAVIVAILGMIIIYKGFWLEWMRPLY